MKRILFIMILSTVIPALAWSAPQPAQVQDTIGIVKNSEGKAEINRGKQAIPAVVGTRLKTGDILSTGPGGSMGVILRDFLFSPTEGKMSLFARLAKGTMAYMSGIIGKLSPESVRFETPVATIGIRGTCFMVTAGEPVPN